jgi:hypothetical protein
MTKRITRSHYNRPTKTFQDTLSNADIKDKLKDYKKVNDISKVMMNTHLRYFTKDKKTGNQLFRLGGVLTKVDPELRYVILSNGDLSWSVQVGTSTFFQKMTDRELRDEIRREVTEEQHYSTNNTNNNINDTEIKELRKHIKILTSKLENYEKLENEYKNMEKNYKNILKKNELLESQLSKIENEIKKEKNKNNKKK